MSDSFVTPWTVAHQAPLSMGFPRQEYWSGLPFLSPGDLPNPGIEPALAGRFFITEPSGKPWIYVYLELIHIAVQWEPTQHWKAIILQKKKRKGGGLDLSLYPILRPKPPLPFLQILIRQASFAAQHETVLGSLSWFSHCWF